VWAASGRWARLPLVATVAGVLMLGGQLEVQQLQRAWHSRTLSREQTPEELLAAAVRRGPPGPLFMWGAASQLYALSGRPPASRFIHAAATSSSLAHDPEMQKNRETLLADFAEDPPSHIVLDPGLLVAEGGTDFPELDRMLASDYALVTFGNDSLGDWRLYRRLVR
jgi:hypothetical protein